MNAARQSASRPQNLTVSQAITGHLRDTMLVYLDHSHLVLLEEVATNSPSEFASFMSFWRAKAFTLAVSIACTS